MSKSCTYRGMYMSPPTTTEEINKMTSVVGI